MNSLEAQKEGDNFNVKDDGNSNKYKIKVLKNNTWGYKSKPKTKRHNKTTKHLQNNHIPNQNSQVRPRKLTSFSDYVKKNSETFTEDEKLPDRIEGTYVYDYNILYIHNILMKKFEQDKKNNLITIKNFIQLEEVKIKTCQTLIERKKSKKLLEQYRDEIQKLQSDYYKNNYLTKAEKYLQTYKKLGPISRVVSFVSNNKGGKIVAPENEKKQKKRHSIIFDYLEICRKYISIDLIRDIPNSDCCPGCGVKREDNPSIENESGSVCPNCYLETINIIRQPFFTDGTRVNNSRNNYEDRINFEKVLSRYQGKQNNKPPKELYQKLDIWFLENNLHSSEYYKNLPLVEGKKEGTTRTLMYKALGDIGCSGYYDDINLIMNVFLGWELPDVSHLEDKIMRDYDLYQIVYEEVLDKEGRKSSLNSQWRLYKHLRLLGWECKRKDFKIPTTPNILEYHVRKWKEGCKVLGWRDVK